MTSRQDDPDLAKELYRKRRHRDLAFLLPCIGAFLYFSPLKSGISSETTLAGIPLVLLFVFGIWAALILAAAWLARRLSGDD